MNHRNVHDCEIWYTASALSRRSSELFKPRGRRGEIGVRWVESNLLGRSAVHLEIPFGPAKTKGSKPAICFSVF